MMPMTTSCSDPVAPVLPVHRPRPALPLLAASTAIGSLGLAAGGTAAALLAVETTGRDAAAGLPLGALAAGQAGASLLVARLTARAGRGAGLVAGYAIGVLGALAVVAAAVLASFPLMLAGSLLLGGANAAIFLSRYAAADIGGPEARGRALGTVLFATTLGTVAGPALLVPTGRLAEALGLPRLTGLYLVAVAAFAAAALAVAVLARRGLPGLGRGSRAAGADGPSRPVTRGQLAAALRPAPARAALVVLGGTNLVMVAIMAVAPVQLLHHGHDLGFVGLAVSLHVADMFGLLIVLGLGWNCGVVGGSALLAASVPPALRPRSEAIGEASMGLAAAAGAPAAGLVVALGGFTTTWVAGALAGAVILAGTRRRP